MKKTHNLEQPSLIPLPSVFADDYDQCDAGADFPEYDRVKFVKSGNRVFVDGADGDVRIILRDVLSRAEYYAEDADLLRDYRSLVLSARRTVALLKPLFAAYFAR